MATLKREVKKLPSEQNLRLLSSLIVSLANKQSSLEDKCIAPWKADVAYQKDISYVSHNGYVYICSVTNQDSVFTESHWIKLSDNITQLEKSDVEVMLNLSQEELDNLQKLLKDDQITTTSTFSSSKIYSDLQAAIDTAKEYTNEQTGKCVKPAYKVVASTSEITETGYFYLISNGTNYDMYVLSADGSVVSLGTSDVDLSDYAKLTDLDNYYDKSTSDSKYATITAVDGKMDKTDIVDNLTSTDTDKPLSANQGKVLKDEVDLKANDDEVVKTADIVTTIDKSSTNDKIPTAKAIYDNPKNKIPVLSTGTDIFAYADSIEEYVTITVKIMNGVNSPYGANVNNDFYYTIYNMPSVNYKRIVAYDIRKNDMYMNIKHVTWGTWQKVCTTSVADVPFTKLTLDSSVFTLVSNGACLAYSVCNGMCTITCCGVGLVSVGNHIVTNNIPKPMGGYASNILQVGAGSNVPTTPVFLIADGNGLAILSSTHTGHFWGTLTYPVAES